MHRPFLQLNSVSGSQARLSGEKDSKITSRFHLAQTQILTTNNGVLVAAVFAISISVASPRVKDTPSTGLTLEIGLWTRQIAILFVTSISAIVRSIADRRRWSAVRVLALEGSRSAVPGWTRARFITSVLAILLAVAHPEPRNTLLIRATTTMLTRCTIRNASLRISGQVELIRTSALVTGRSLLNVTFDIQVRRLWRWGQQTQVRTSTIVRSTRIRVSNLPQWVVDMHVIRSMGGIPYRL